MAWKRKQESGRSRCEILLRNLRGNSEQMSLGQKHKVGNHQGVVSMCGGG